MVKVISQRRMDGSVVFARWR